MKTFTSVHFIHLWNRSWTDILAPQILALASLLSITSAAPFPAAAAASAGYIVVYDVVACPEAENITPVHYELPEGSCVDISPAFLSFQGKTSFEALKVAQSAYSRAFPGGLSTACPAGTTATVFGFEGIGCTETSHATSTLPANHAFSACINTVFLPSSGEGVDVAAQSAKFSCVVWWKDG